MKMRDPERIYPLMAEVYSLWHEHPDLRLGQLMCNLMGFVATKHDPFYVEDDEMLELLKQYRSFNKPIKGGK